MTLNVIDGDLWQWDTGREAEVVGCDQVHFAKSTTGTCYTVEVAGGKAKIPDELLQAAGRMYAWAYITDEVPGGRTRIEAIWDVRRRAKPAGYIYEPADRNTIKDAETARDEAKAAQKAAEAARDRAVAAEVKGARATTLASGSDATAAMEGNVLVVGVPKGDALRYSDLTAEQVAELKKPATDAAAAVSKVNDEFKQLKASAETAEKGRADAEGGRRRAEEMRGTSETERDTAEKAREQAEASRANDERARVSAESSRSSAEDERTSAESAREQAEAKRAKAEEQRARDSKTRLGELARAKADAETATGEANTARDEAKLAAKAATDAAASVDKSTAACTEASVLATSAAARADDAADKALSASTSASGAASSASSAAASAGSAASEAGSAANEARSAAAKADASAIADVDVTTLGPGSEATVSIVKGESGQAITLGIPRGAKGDTGAKGDPFIYDDFTEEQITELQRPASEAATRADAAAKTASDAADRVDVSIESANTAAAGATAAKEAANAAATKADDAASSASSAASAASSAATKAETAASLANSAASSLDDIKKQASDAVAKANSAADRVDASIASAETAAATANESASSANGSASTANAAAKSANAAAEGAKAATASANDATDRLTTLEGQVASNESARTSAEESRASAETARADAESARVESESARSAAETSRAASEQARAKAEKARSDADAQRETRQLRNDADQAQNNAAARGFTYHLCGEGEYAPDSVDGEHNVPTVDGEAGVMYLTPKVDGASDEDAYDQWLFVGSKWELVGSSNAAHIDPVTTDDIDGISGGGTVTADRYLNATGLSYAWRKLTSGVSTDIETAVGPVLESVNDLKGKLSETKSVSDDNKSRIDTMGDTVTGNSEAIENIVANVTDSAKRLGAVESKAADNTGRISALETKVSGMGTGGASVRAGGQDLSVVLADKISASRGTVYSVLHELVASEDFSNIMVGDYFDVTVGYIPAISDRSIRFVVAHINPYKGVGKSETASHIALVSAQPLTVESNYQYAAGGSYLLWNSSSTNNSPNYGGCPYADSVLHKTEISLGTGMPDEFEQYIIERQAYLEKRYDGSNDSTGNSWTKIGKFWSLSEKEVFGCDVLGTKGYSVGADVQFDLFKSGDALTSGRKSWWLRTVAGGSTTKACYVDSTGAPMAKDVTGAYVRPRVALLFG